MLSLIIFPFNLKIERGCFARFKFNFYFSEKTMTTCLPLLPQFGKFISTCKKGKRTKYIGKKLAPGTITQYECVYQLLQEFEQKENISIKIELCRKQSIQIIKREKKYWEKFFQKFLQFLYKDKECFDNYVCSVLKILNTFFNYLSEEKSYPISKFYKSFKINTEEFHPIILSPSQLDFLINDKDFESKLSSHLKKTKDIFIFGCTVALRYSDLMRLKKEHVIDSPDGKYLLIHTKKTSTLVKLPLPDYLLSIINKYQKIAGKNILPRLSATNLNIQVKALCKKAGWNYVVPKVRYKQGKPIEMKNENGSSLSFADQVTTHTMRRTAITTLLVLGVPEHIVRRISGHAPNSKEFYRYVVIAQEYLNKHVLEAYSKLAKSA